MWTFVCHLSNQPPLLILPPPLHLLSSDYLGGHLSSPIFFLWVLALSHHWIKNLISECTLNWLDMIVTLFLMSSTNVLPALPSNPTKWAGWAAHNHRTQCMLVLPADHLRHLTDPENILLDNDLNIKITDFGLSNELSDGDFRTTSCGILNYTVSEVIGDSLVSLNVDVWISMWYYVGTYHLRTATDRSPTLLLTPSSLPTCHNTWVCFCCPRPGTWQSELADSVTYPCSLLIPV